MSSQPHAHDLPERAAGGGVSRLGKPCFDDESQARRRRGKKMNAVHIEAIPIYAGAARHCAVEDFKGWGEHGVEPTKSQAFLYQATPIPLSLSNTIAKLFCKFQHGR